MYNPTSHPGHSMTGVANRFCMIVCVRCRTGYVSQSACRLYNNFADEEDNSTNGINTHDSRLFDPGSREHKVS
jgi:hypothetical protein